MGGRGRKKDRAKPARVTVGTFVDSDPRSFLGRDVTPSPSRQRLPIAFRCPRSRSPPARLPPPLPARVMRLSPSPREEEREGERFAIFRSLPKEYTGWSSSRLIYAIFIAIVVIERDEMRILPPPPPSKLVSLSLREIRGQYLKVERSLCIFLSLPPLILAVSFFLAIGTSANGRVFNTSPNTCDLLTYPKRHEYMNVIAFIRIIPCTNRPDIRMPHTWELEKRETEPTLSRAPRRRIRCIGWTGGEKARKTEEKR